ncbi:MAG: family 20 glycosylhydrolase, partial [Clostridia bacterium]|nr:family 20 glycosylhydrolase [Clostridia bacterium]
KHLSELRDGICDMFGGHPTDLCEACPSLDETHEFFDKYISEVAEIFPSKYFHVGLDEIFNIGLCDKCRDYEGGIPKIFADQVNHSYNLLKKLGKHMMMWEDMFEMCPEALEMVPNDITICVWNYRYISDGMVGHLNASCREDQLDRFISRGFEVLCCCHTNMSNIDSYLNYAGRHETIGFLVTIWELSREQFEFMTPYLAYFSRRYNGENDFLTALKGAVKDVFPLATDSFVSALSTVMNFFVNGGNWTYPADLTSNALPDRLDYIELASRKIALDALESSVPQCYSRHPSYVAMRDNCRIHVINFSLLYIHQDLTECRVGLKKCDTAAHIEKLGELYALAKDTYDSQKALWDDCRGGLPSPDLDKKFNNLLKTIEGITEIANNTKFGTESMLTVNYFTNDTWNIPMFAVTLIYADGSTYEVMNGSRKPVALEMKAATYTVNYILPDNRVPVAVKLMGRGFGGAGYGYVEAVICGKRCVPHAISDVCGMVKSPENVLRYDNCWCYMGDENVCRCSRNLNITKYENSITVLLK